MDEMLDLGGALGYRVQAHPALEPLLVDIQNITPHPENPHNGDVDAIMESIRASGVYRPLWVQVSTGRILGGNHTYAALMELGADRAPVVWLDVDDDEALRILLKDNKLAELGGYDDGMLAALLVQVQDTGGLLGTGWTNDGLDALLASVRRAEHTPLNGEVQPDQCPAKCRCLCHRI
jgi:hypothetical protein